MSESKCYAADGVTECHSVHGVGVLVSAVAYNGLLSENETLRAELAEARRQLKEASEQEPVEWKVESGTGTTRRFSTYAATKSHRDEGWTATPLYAAPVPQPAVPEAVARDAARYRWLRDQHNRHLGLTICKVNMFDLEPWSGDDPDTAIDAAILSATDSEVKNGLR